MMSNQQSSASQTEAKSEDPIVLAVDTSSPQSSCAVAQGERILATIYSHAFIPHSRTFFTNLATLLKLANLEIGRIDLFAAATGPGSFTGLRVGLAAIKGLARSLGKPALGVNSIDLQALSLGVSGLVLVLIDAGRDEIYGGVRKIDARGGIEAIGDDRVGPVSSLIEDWLTRLSSILIVGSGADRFKEELEVLAATHRIPVRTGRFVQPAFEGWQIIGQTEFTPAAELARRAGGMIAAGVAPEIHAYYVRPSDAEIKR